jgi:hypothetical protein
MKHLPKIICLLLPALLLSLSSCEKKTDPEADARDFLSLVSEEKTKEAFAKSDLAFQLRQTEQSFGVNAKEAGFVGAKAPVLTRRESKDAGALFDGKTVTSGGMSLEFEMKLIWERGAWRVVSLLTRANDEERTLKNHFTLVGRQATIGQDRGRIMPSKEQINALVREAMEQFSRGLQAKDFGEFYNFISPRWQDQISKVRLYRRFEAFIEHGVDFADVVNMEPVFDEPPALTDDGLLTVRGHFNTPPPVKYFDLTFIYELPRWRLFGIKARLETAGQQTPAPSPSTAQDGNAGVQ